MSKTTKFFILFLTFALAVASAASYQVTLFQPSTVSGKDLKPGDYKLTIDNDKVTMVKGKERIEASIKLETADSKFSTTSVRYSEENGKTKIQEIRLGGTTTRVVFN
jgi:hypothetical protein